MSKGKMLQKGVIEPIVNSTIKIGNKYKQKGDSGLKAYSKGFGVTIIKIIFSIAGIFIILLLLLMSI